ncbi:LysR substrate-binding domain-containing protein [Beijerinckia sp. L45]|uniref:LysR substrate-binding domain-containing protein n=1 Tax=Beijerinckia sp. L45 TaxID=1641855 RepID=UPI00131EB7E5|nr:LysR substrate-binding domain-containing protein [Beijerinckia sp. L45]
MTDHGSTRINETMQLRHVNALIAVADTGSLRTAAKRLGIAQPSLTKIIREIEMIMGVPLIERTVRGSIPNEFGHILLRRARAISEEFRRAKEEMDQLAGVGGGSVTIGLSAGAALLLSDEAISGFMKANPDAQINVREGLFDQLVNGVRQNRLDFSVGGLPLGETGSGVETELLFQNKIVPAARRGHGLAKARSFEALIGSNWALTNDEPTFFKMLEEHFQQLGLAMPQVLLKCESFFTILQLVPQTDLIVAIPQSLLRHPMVEERLIAIDVKDKFPYTQFALVRKAGARLTPLAEQLAGHVRKAAKKVAGSFEVDA